MHAWDEFLKHMEHELGKDVVQKWLRPLRVSHFDAQNIYIEASDSFLGLWFEEHVRFRAQKHLVTTNKKPIKVHIAVKKAAPSLSKTAAPTPPPQPQIAPSLQTDSLDPANVFDSFVCSPANILPYKFLNQVANSHHNSLASESKDLANCNPVYLWGPSGTGKSHLLMAAANRLCERGRKVLYIRAQTFTEHVVSAIRGGFMQQFRALYRNVDVLLFDDVQHLGGKAATQEEFFHTFNTLHVENHLIIVSANCPPQQLSGVEPRLISRFEWGITLNLEPLDEASCREVLSKKAQNLRFSLADKTLDYLIEHFHSSTASCVRALDALVLHSHLEQREGHAPRMPLDLPTAERYLSELLKQEKHAALSPSKIVQAVASHYGIKTDDILSRAQSRDVTLPRQIAMLLCRQQLKMPFTKIGSFFSRDHSTVMTSIRQIEKALAAKEIEISSSVNSISRKIQEAFS